MKIYRFRIAKNIYQDVTIRNNTIIVNSFKLFNEELTDQVLLSHKLLDGDDARVFVDYLKTDDTHSDHNLIATFDTTPFYDNVVIDAKHVGGPSGLVGMLLFCGKTVLKLDEVHQRDYAHYLVGQSFIGHQSLKFINTTPYTLVSKDSFDYVVNFLDIVPSVRMFLPSRYSKLTDDSGFMVVYENESYPTKFTIESEGVEVDPNTYQRASGQRASKLESLYNQHMPKVTFEMLERTDEYVKLLAYPVVINEFTNNQEPFAYPMRLEFTCNCGYIPVNQYEYDGNNPLEVLVYLDKVPSGLELVLKANTSTFSNLGQFNTIV